MINEDTPAEICLYTYTQSKCTKRSCQLRRD